MTQPDSQDRPADNDTVMRRIPANQTIPDEETSALRPGSNAFLQGGPDGDVSVFLSSETTPGRITAGYPGTYIALIRIGDVRSLGLEVEREPIEEQPGHCNITGRKTRAKARALANSSTWAEGFAPPPVANGANG